MIYNTAEADKKPVCFENGKGRFPLIIALVLNQVVIGRARGAVFCTQTRESDDGAAYKLCCTCAEPIIRSHSTAIEMVVWRNGCDRRAQSQKLHAFWHFACVLFVSTQWLQFTRTNTNCNARAAVILTLHGLRCNIHQRPPLCVCASSVVQTSRRVVVAILCSEKTGSLNPTLRMWRQSAVTELRRHLVR